MAQTRIRFARRCLWNNQSPVAGPIWNNEFLYQPQGARLATFHKSVDRIYRKGRCINKSKSNFIPDFEEEEESAEMQLLPENPTDEDFMRYAENHQLVKKVLRMFRGKIVEITHEPADFFE